MLLVIFVDYDAFPEYCQVLLRHMTPILAYPKKKEKKKKAFRMPQPPDELAGNVN